MITRYLFNVNRYIFLLNCGNPRNRGDFSSLDYILNHLFSSSDMAIQTAYKAGLLSWPNQSPGLAHINWHGTIYTAEQRKYINNVYS